DCKEIIEEISKIIWETKRGTGSDSSQILERPKKGNDHLMDSLRYITFPLLKLGPSPQPINPPGIYEAMQQAITKDILGFGSTPRSGIDEITNSLYQLEDII
ncbi:MAG: hypothetical protein MI923_13330, partial [Phycisphaerales bacterium]|nr:hypothetical protein [Phycisphaerales bacterium]